MSESTIGNALLAAQKDFPELQKNAINPHFKNSYISLDSLMEQILPVLNKHGIVLIQQPSTILYDGGVAPTLTTTLLHAESKTTVDSTMLLMLAKDDPQGQGSAITYARRYSLMAVLGLVADEDDDAQSTKPAATKAVRSSGSTARTTSASGSGAL